MRFDIKIETNDDNEFIVWATCRSLNWDVWGKADTLEKAIKEFDKEFKELVVNKHDALDMESKK